MASLEKRPHGYRVVFMFRGEKFAKSLHTKEIRQANSSVARLEDTLRRVELGTLVVPEDADVATFLLSDGNLAAKPKNEKPLTLTELFDAYFANLPAGANEATTLSGMRTHQRHLERLLGSGFAVQRLTSADLQTFIEKRSKEKGFRGKVTTTTIKKALVTFRTIWRWGMISERVKGPFPNRGLKFPKSSEKPPFQTWVEIDRQIGRGGLSEVEIAELWDCLYLTLPEINELLATGEARPPLSRIHSSDVRLCRPHRGEAFGNGSFANQRPRLRRESNAIIPRTEESSLKGGRLVAFPSRSCFGQTLKEWLKQHPGGNATFAQPAGVLRAKDRSKEEPKAPSRGTKLTTISSERSRGANGPCFAAGTSFGTRSSACSRRRESTSGSSIRSSDTRPKKCGSVTAICTRARSSQ